MFSLAAIVCVAILIINTRSKSMSAIDFMQMWLPVDLVVIQNG